MAEDVTSRRLFDVALPIVLADFEAFHSTFAFAALLIWPSGILALHPHMHAPHNFDSGCGSDYTTQNQGIHAEIIFVGLVVARLLARTPS